MAESNHTESTDPEGRANNPGRSLDPFMWYPKSIEGFPHISTLNTIKSLSGGVAAVLEIIEANELYEGDSYCFGSVLQPFQVSALMRLAIAVSGVIEAECDLAMEWTEKHGANRINVMAKQMESAIDGGAS
jgi:hypothetical protein